MKRRGKVCRALHVRGRWGEYISSPHPTETVGTYEAAYRSIRGIIMETKEKEQKDEKKSDTTPKPLKAIASAPAVQAVKSSSFLGHGAQPSTAVLRKITKDWAIGRLAREPADDPVPSVFAIPLCLLPI